jgi:hypothetical protein
MLITQRDIAYNIWDKHRTDENRARFKLLSKKTTYAVRAAKRRQSASYLDPDLPAKSLWRNLKTMGVKNDQDQEVIFSAEELNTYYSTTCPQSGQLPSTIPSTQTQSTDQGPNTSRETFSFQNVDKFEVKNAILRVKSTAIGLDGISLNFF